jgi:rhamnosyltransferase
MKILVILASYNGEKYIKEQLESILSQDGVLVEIKIFDDVSKDKTIQVIDSFCNDERVQLIKNELSTGSAAKNFFSAIKYLRDDILNQYDYISFSDQDDIWLADKLIAASEMLKKDCASLYMSNLILWEEKNGKKSVINKSYSQKKFDYLFEGGSAGCTYVFTNTFCIDLKRTLEKVDYSDWKFFSHDWFVYFFARLNDYIVSIDTNAYILYRIHDNNVHGQLNTISIFAIKERLKMIKQGWYFMQIDGFIKLTLKDSTERRIYELYTKNYLTRLFLLLRYNFSLMRSSKKFIQFFIISLLPIRINKKYV